MHSEAIIQVNSPDMNTLYDAENSPRGSSGHMFDNREAMSDVKAIDIIRHSPSQTTLENQSRENSVGRALEGTKVDAGTNITKHRFGQQIKKEGNVKERVQAKVDQMGPDPLDEYEGEIGRQRSRFQKELNENQEMMRKAQADRKK